MSAVRPATFTGFDPYKLTGVRVTDRELGHGSYATVLELEYMGLKCAGKKIHELLLRQGDASYTVRRFEEEYRLLSQVRHPNIVQFLGVYFQQAVQAPILIMEFLPTNITSCIEQYGILPKEICYSILYDVALGLCYLHRQTPPIIHRDLSSNNVLLTPNMTAKISDLGVARILNLTPLQVSHMTQTPGTPAYMPPEVMVANPKYDRSVDEFSYGIMMIHMFSGRWPEPQVGPNCTEPDGRLIPVTEAERREVFLRAIGNDHPLMDLILKCINNHPRARAHAGEIVKQLAEMVLQFPASFTNRLEMLRQIEAIEGEKRALTEEGERKDRAVQQKESQISSLRENVEAEKKQNSAKIDQLKLAHSNEVEQLRLQVRDLNAQKQLVTSKMEAEIAELISKATLYESQIETKSKALTQEREQSKQIIAKEREQLDIQLAQERERIKSLMADNHDLQSILSKLRSENAAFQHTISELHTAAVDKDSIIQMNEALVRRKNSDLEAKNRALEEKDAAISAMSEQITKTRNYLATKQQVLQASITWKQCANLPTGYFDGMTAVINSKIYCGGGTTLTPDDDDGDYIIYCYDPLQDKWTTLPPLPVRWFGLGQVNGKLVAVGGQEKIYEENTSKVLTYDEKSQKWKQTIPPMPTARWASGVLSFQSALVVAGGYISSHSYTAAVEVFKSDTSQWCRTDPLPRACQGISLVAIGNTYYALGGSDGSYFNQALYVSVDDLLCNAVPVNQTTHGGSSVIQSAWKTLPNTPTYGPAAAVLAGNLLAIGGEETSVMKEVYMYFPSTNSWIYISDLPAPRSFTTVAILSSTEILVIGGWYRGRMNTVYKGTLHL